MGLRSDLREVSAGWRWSHQPLVPRSAEPWVPPQEDRTIHTAWARSVVAGQAREVIQTGVLGPLLRLTTRPAVHGLDHLDRLAGPVVFVSNHASHLDAPLVLCSLPREWRERTAVGAAADYFFDVWWRSAVTALAFNAFPIDRAGGRDVTSTAMHLVADDVSLLLFPEGTRSTDGWMNGFRHGAARLCMELGVPAVPIAIRGSYAAMPRSAGWPRPGRPPVSVRFGPPLEPADGERPRDFSDRLRHGVARVWDEDETTWYASLRRAADGATPSAGGPDAPRWRRVWEASRPLPPAERPRVWARRR